MQETFQLHVYFIYEQIARSFLFLTLPFYTTDYLKCHERRKKGYI